MELLIIESTLDAYFVCIIIKSHKHHISVMQKNPLYRKLFLKHGIFFFFFKVHVKISSARIEKNTQNIARNGPLRFAFTLTLWKFVLRWKNWCCVSGEKKIPRQNPRGKILSTRSLHLNPNFWGSMKNIPAQRETPLAMCEP